MMRPTPTLSATLAPMPRRLPALASDAILWAALLFTLVPQLVRATSNFTAFPAWDQDPLTYALSSPAITPAGSLLIDTLTLLGAALLFVRIRLLAIPFNIPLLLLAAIGAIPVILHGWFLGPGSQHGSLDAQHIGSSWLAGIISAVALWHAAQDTRTRRLVVGTLLGLISVLALFGIVQVFYLHAQTVADFNANRERFLTAHGWSPDSSMAKSFIRRLDQPEASAWFGLANVYATFAAASAAASLVLFSAAIHSRLRPNTLPASLPRTLLLGLFSALSLTALTLAHSKGGNLAFAAATGSALAIALLLPRVAPRVLRPFLILLGLAAILAPIALVLIRGLFGTRISELSLLFRSFYAHASARIFADNPLLGVGPDGFQRAFTLAKSPLCPEEVSSPHCIPLDYLADLGICGLAWVILLARLSMNAAANILQPPTEDTSPSHISSASFALSRPDLRLLVALPVAATLLAVFIESPFITPEIAIIRIGGLLLWCPIAWAIASALGNDRASRLALLAAALALVAHAQIDVTGSFPGSAPLWLMLIGAAAAPFTRLSTAPRSSQTTRPWALLPFIATLAVTVFSAVAHHRARDWESHLLRAAEIVRPIPEISDRLAALAKPATGVPTDSIDAVIRDLRTLTNNPSLTPTPASLAAARSTLFQTLLPKAITELESAASIYPDERHVLREASRLHTHLAAMALDAGRPDTARASFDAAVRVLRILPDPAGTLTQLPSPGATEYHWLASVLERRAQTLADTEARRQAIAARLQVAALDPYNLDNALKLFRNYQALGDAPEASRWAARTLLLHDYTRLDRETRGLSPSDLADAQAAAPSSPPAP